MKDQIYTVNKDSPPPVWLPDSDMSGVASLLIGLIGLLKFFDQLGDPRCFPFPSVSQYDVESLHNISKETKTPRDHPVSPSLDVATEVDVAADTSGGEHSPLRHHRVVLQSIIRIVGEKNIYN